MSAIASDELLLVLAALDPPAPEVRALAALLSDDEHARAERLHFDRDRRRFVVARGTLRKLLASYTSSDARALRFAYGPHGKPALAGGGLAFNLSHSADVALFAFALGFDGALGVDIEAIRADLDVDEMARTFAPREIAALQALRPEERADAFFVAWTRKEAYIKALGTGFSLAPDRFSVSIDPAEQAALLATTYDADDPAAWWFATIRPCPGFVASCAVRSGGRRLAVRVVNGPSLV